jgi:UDP-3-O-[3-hydroxymyristoyl] N-acetylglucosamine deacetylase
VIDTRLCTMIGNANKATVGTIEHVMAALRGCGIDNVRIDINGPEVPVMDGSSAPFVCRFDEVGAAAQGLAPSRHQGPEGSCC